MTNDLAQAKTWARRLSRKGRGVVLEFRVDESVLAGMRNLHIKDPKRLAEFIRHHRAGGMTAPFDIVEGMMLGNPGSFMSGAAPSLFGHQMAFLSDDALRALNAGLQP